MKTPVMTVLLLLPFLGLQGSSPELPEYTVRRTPEPIYVDGSLTDLAWLHAEEVGPFRDNVSGKVSPLETSAKLVWDSEYLYFAFESEDRDLWATFHERDQHLWTEEVVEVFLKGDPAHPNYIELEVNPLGTMLDIYLIDIRKPIPYASWDSEGLQWAVTIDGSVNDRADDRLWRCEIALPLTDVITAPHIPPLPGDRWGLNLYRVESRPERAGLAWSPTLKRDFHVPSRFGSIVFSGKLVTEK